MSPCNSTFVTRTCASSGASPREAARGLSIVEVMVVLALAAILASVAIPSLQGTMQMNRLETASNQFVAALSMARSEAVKQGARVTVCPAAAGLPCPLVTVYPTDWSQGWNVCCTPSSNPAATAAVPTNPPAAVTSSGPLAAPMTLWGNVSAITFDPMGRLPVGTSAGDFLFCVDGVDAKNSRGITIVARGRVHMDLPSEHVNRYPMDDLGNPMSSCRAP